MDRKAAVLKALREIDMDIDYRAVDTGGLKADVQGWGDQDEIFDYVFRHWSPQVLLPIFGEKYSARTSLCLIASTEGISKAIPASPTLKREFAATSSPQPCKRPRRRRST